ncbi:hypothetical protein DdX_11873 [Ditylenchus destructor]|uniref:Uncharacterized protein n=1 Tax=Ditylenchus destructor TaxID=166010 RepID=A0AAD4N1J6_9BILA|nr:hypothetical protein DdX_11873 [Ditylenchus destructor]
MNGPQFLTVIVFMLVLLGNANALMPKPQCFEPGIHEEGVPQCPPNAPYNSNEDLCCPMWSENFGHGPVIPPSENN